MDFLRFVQLATNLAYLLLGITAVVVAIRRPERTRTDIALLFGALGLAVALQEIWVLTCPAIAPSGPCIVIPGSTSLLTLLILALPYLLLRVVESIDDVPRWATWVTLGLFGVLATAALLSPPSPIVGVVVILYLSIGSLYAAFSFVRRARATAGITARRMFAVAWGCGLLGLVFVFTLATLASPIDASLFATLSRLAALASGLCFYLGFFPPSWLSQTWRLPELFAYLRPRQEATQVERSGPNFHDAAAADAIALERLCAAVTRTTGAVRSLLVLEDRSRGDFYLWGAPSARIQPDEGMVGKVISTGRAMVVRSVNPASLARAVLTVFASEPLPRTSIMVPILVEKRVAGALCVYADKGPMFVEDDLDVMRFFASEVATILQMRQYREVASEVAALREADRLKDEFMAVVSHELRTPLTAISGYSDILLRKLSGPLNERQERQVTGIRDASRRLLALINDLLDVSKLEAGTLDLHLQPLDATSAMARAVAGTRIIAANKGVQLEVRDSDDNLPPVLADEERLQQILVNLLANAIKFTPQGGSVWIAVGEEVVETGPQIVYRIHDTGVGLAPDQASRVWDRFYQVESSSTRRFGGAGLGLSIVRRLAELHGGKAEASSAGINQGSTFKVYLPSALSSPLALPRRVETPLAPAVEDGPPPAPALDVLSGPLVLVVEDDVDIASVLRTYLEADGYSVAIATDGQQAIQSARTYQPFAITLDISLPKLDGWSVLNALKREPITAAIPVVVVSIVDNKDFGMILGASEYLVKPIDHERLRAVLKNLIGTPAHANAPILVVDDDPDIRDVIGSSLTADGWRVLTAANGSDALALLAETRPSAVLLDLMMPDVDGFDVLRAVRADPRLRDLPVIVVTARDLTEDDRVALSGAAQRIVSKQALRLDDLRREVRAVLDGHRGRSEARDATDAA